jgi:MarR family transcriptional regulator, organic hydroperoxide resistance regulator
MQSKQILPPHRSVGYQVRRCHRGFDRLLTDRLIRHELNAGFWYYLRALWIQGGLTQKELSDITNVTENTTVTMIDLMIERGLVERTRDVVDRRKMRISLTPRGRKLEEELMPYAFEINEIAAAGITRSEVEICLSVLSRIGDNLQAALSKPSGKPRAQTATTKRRSPLQAPQQTRRNR